MGDDDSVFSRVRRTISGPTPVERAATLDDRASSDPDAFDAADIEELIELLDADDPDAVGDALSALESLGRARPALVEPAVEPVVDGLSARPADEWSSTTLGEASTSFLQDLSRGSILLSVAQANPDALDPVVDELADRYTDGTIEPMTMFAFAYAVAAEPDRVDVRPESVVARVANALRDAVEAAAESDDGWTDLTLQPMATTGYIDLLASFDTDSLDDDAAADARDALETARSESDDEAVVEAAGAALSEND